MRWRATPIKPTASSFSGPKSSCKSCDPASARRAPRRLGAKRLRKELQRRLSAATVHKVLVQHGLNVLADTQKLTSQAETLRRRLRDGGPQSPSAPAVHALERDWWKRRSRRRRHGGRRSARAETEKRSPPLWVRRSWISSSVAGVRRIKLEQIVPPAPRYGRRRRAPPKNCQESCVRACLATALAMLTPKRLAAPLRDSPPKTTASTTRLRRSSESAIRDHESELNRFGNPPVDSVRSGYRSKSS